MSLILHERIEISLNAIARAELACFIQTHFVSERLAVVLRRNPCQD